MAIKGSRAAGAVDDLLLPTVGVAKSLDRDGQANLFLYLGALRSQGYLKQRRSLVIAQCRSVVSELLLTNNFEPNPLRKDARLPDPNDWVAYKKYVLSVARRIESASASLDALDELISPPAFDRMRMERLRRRAAEVHRNETGEVISDPLGLRDQELTQALRRVRLSLRTMTPAVVKLSREVKEMRRRPKAFNRGNQLALQLCRIWFEATAMLPMVTPARRHTADDPFYEFCKLVAGLAPLVNGRLAFPLTTTAVEHVARSWRAAAQLNADDSI